MYIAKKKKKNWKLPITKKELVHTIGQWNRVPLKMLYDMAEQELLFKSPHSFSFYSKPKDWAKTEPDTIRWSNHWNFKSKDTVDKIHAITDIEIPEEIWYWHKGVYNSETGIYTIVESYGKSTPNKKEMRELNRFLCNKYKEFFVRTPVIIPKPSIETIEKRRAFSKLIDAGLVLYNYEGTLLKVLKLGRNEIKLENDIVLKKIVSQTFKHKTFTSRYKDFMFIINGTEYTEDRLIDEDLL